MPVLLVIFERHLLRFHEILQKKNRQPSDVNFTHARNFPFIFNVKLHACTKIDVEIFLQDFIKPQYSVLPFYGTTIETVPFFYYTVSCRISTDKTGSVCPVYVESFSCGTFQPYSLLRLQHALNSHSMWLGSHYSSKTIQANETYRYKQCKGQNGASYMVHIGLDSGA